MPTTERRSYREHREDKIRYLTPDERRRLFKAITSPRDRAIFLTAYQYGLRASEIGLLYITDVDFKRNRIRITRLKRSNGGEYHLHPDITKAIKAYLKKRSDDSPYLFLSRKGHPISRNQLHMLMQRYGELADLPDDKRHFHVLKHTIGFDMADDGYSAFEIQDWLGHRNIQNTMVYTNISSSHRDQVARKMFEKRRKL